jgi:hypothetical protein
MADSRLSTLKACLSLGLFLTAGVVNVHAASWTTSARRFTGESASVREKAIATLRKMPDLKSELKKSLGTSNHFLALDVISVLELREMLPELLEFAARDKTGYSYHVISSLIGAKDHDRVGQIYLDRIDNPKTAPASKMAMLDAAARMEITLGPERTKRLLKDDSPEVRSSVLSLFRTELLRRNYQRGLTVLETTIDDPTFQIRLQTLYLISELPGSLRRANLSLIEGVFARCKDDPVPSVKELCTSLAAGAGT